MHSHTPNPTLSCKSTHQNTFTLRQSPFHSVLVTDKSSQFWVRQGRLPGTGRMFTSPHCTLQSLNLMHMHSYRHQQQGSVLIVMTPRADTLFPIDTTKIFSGTVFQMAAGAESGSEPSSMVRHNSTERFCLIALALVPGFIFPRHEKKQEQSVMDQGVCSWKVSQLGRLLFLGMSGILVHFLSQPHSKCKNYVGYQKAEEHLIHS